MRVSSVAGFSILLALVACASDLPRTSSTAPKKTPTTISSPEIPKPETPVPRFRVLEHIGFSFDDALESCTRFDGDGLPGDKDGISGKAAMLLAYESLETKVLSDGSEALCRIGNNNVGSKGCTFEEGYWLHLFVKADGKKVELPNDLRTYRVHYGEVDAWLWQSELSGKYESTARFSEFCTEDAAQ